MEKTPEFVLEREFDAPVDLVWKAWTDPDLLSRWYGPGVETIIHRYDLEPGGEWRNEMRFGERSDLSKMTFQEVVPEEKLVWHHTAADAEWNTTSNQMMPDWPKTLLTTVTFSQADGKTLVRLTWVPLDATDAENECFANMVAKMGNGWEGGYAIIDTILTELQAA